MSQLDSFSTSNMLPLLKYSVGNMPLITKSLNINIVKNVDYDLQ